jgi:hypothetical protein
LNDSEQKSREGLKCLNGVKQKGFFCHPMILTDAEGCPEGLIEQAFYDRIVSLVNESGNLTFRFWASNAPSIDSFNGFRRRYF